MRTTIFVLILALSVSSAAQAQTRQQVANIASWATVGTALALDLHRVLQDRNDRAHQVHLFAARAFVNVVAAEAVKRLVARERPDGSDHKSFYSQHTAFAFSTLGGPRLSFVVPLAVTSGGLRVAARKHYWTDVLAGAAVGAITSRIR